MTETDTFTKILLILIILHFVVGFGYLIYKLSPQKKKDSTENEQNKKEL